MIVVNINALPTVGRTDAPAINRKLSVELIGTVSNRDAVGARVTLRTESGKRQTQVSLAGRGYESYYGKRLYFGTGSESAKLLEIRWPSGQTEQINIPPDSTFMRLIERR